MFLLCEHLEKKKKLEVLKQDCKDDSALYDSDIQLYIWNYLSQSKLDAVDAFAIFIHHIKHLQSTLRMHLAGYSPLLIWSEREVFPSGKCTG
jgi:hypothetical protein